MVKKGTQGIGVDQFFSEAHLPGYDECIKSPERCYRWVSDFDSPYAKEDQAATHGGTIEFDWSLTQGNSTGDCDFSTTESQGVWKVASEGASKFDAAQIQLDSALLTVTANTVYGMIYRYKVDDISEAGYFIGLAERGCTILHTSGDFTTKDYIGHGADTTTEGTSLYFCFNDAGATEGATAFSPTKTIVDDTYLWAGFVCNGVTWAKQWADGVWSAAIETSDLPPVDNLLAPLVLATDEGTNVDTIVSVDYMEVRCYQDRWSIDD